MNTRFLTQYAPFFYISLQTLIRIINAQYGVDNDDGDDLFLTLSIVCVLNNILTLKHKINDDHKKGFDFGVHSFNEYFQRLSLYQRGLCNGIGFVSLQFMASEDLDYYLHLEKAIINIPFDEFPTSMDDILLLNKLPQRRYLSSDITPYDIYAFFEVVLYSQAIHFFPYLFNKYNFPSVQSGDSALPLISTRKLESLGGLVKLNSFTGVYDNLMDYFSSLQLFLGKVSTTSLPLCLLLSNNNHVINCGFSFKNQSWVFIPEAGGYPDFYTDISLLVDCINYRLGGKVKILASNFYCARSTKKELNVTLKEWIQSSHWERLHEVNEDNIYFQGTTNSTWLQLACREGDDNVVIKLLLAGARINYQDEHGYTPLMYAVSEKQSFIVDILFANPALNPHIMNKSGISPIQQIVLSNYFGLLRKFITYQIDTTSEFSFNVSLIRAIMTRHQRAEIFAKFIADKNSADLKINLTLDKLAKLLGFNDLFYLLHYVRLSKDLTLSETPRIKAIKACLNKCLSLQSDSKSRKILHRFISIDTLIQKSNSEAAELAYLQYLESINCKKIELLLKNRTEKSPSEHPLTFFGLFKWAVVAPLRTAGVLLEKLSLSV